MLGSTGPNPFHPGCISIDIHLTLQALTTHPASFRNYEEWLKFLKIGFLELIFSWICFINTYIDFNLPPTTDHFHPLQAKKCDRNPRLVVDEDDSGKFRLGRVKPAMFISTKLSSLQRRDIVFMMTQLRYQGYCNEHRVESMLNIVW